MYLVQESQSESNDPEETSKLGLKVRLTWLPVVSVWEHAGSFPIHYGESLHLYPGVPIGVEFLPWRRFYWWGHQRIVGCDAREKEDRI